MRGRAIKAPATSSTTVTDKVRATSTKRMRKVNEEAKADVAAVTELPSVGDCVIVKYVVRKKTMKYAAIVTQIIDNDIKVNFLQATNESKKVFVRKDNDHSWETIEDIIESKVQFQIGNRGQYVFENKMDVQ